MRKLTSTILLLFFLGFGPIKLVKAQDSQPLLSYTIDELLDDFTRFPVRTSKMFKRKGFRCSGKITEVQTNEKDGTILVTFRETSKRVVFMKLRNRDFQKSLIPKAGEDFIFSAYLVFGGQATNGCFIIELEEYYPGLPLARPVEPLQNEVQIERALRVVQTGQTISVEEINSIFGKPFDEMAQINRSTVGYVWRLGKHLVTIQLDEGKIIGIRHDRPKFN